MHTHLTPLPFSTTPLTSPQHPSPHHRPSRTPLTSTLFTSLPPQRTQTPLSGSPHNSFWLVSGWAQCYLSPVNVHWCFQVVFQLVHLWTIIRPSVVPVAAAHTYHNFRARSQKKKVKIALHWGRIMIFCLLVDNTQTVASLIMLFTVLVWCNYAAWTS